MPKAGKIFLHREPLPPEDAKEKLEGFREFVDIDELDTQLITDVGDLEIVDGELSGVFRHDDVVRKVHRGVNKIVPFTEEAPFLFTRNGDAEHLIVLARKAVANNAANTLSRVLHEGKIGVIVQPVMSPKAIQNFYENECEGAKILLFDGIAIPNLSKLTLYGENVVQTNLHGEYINEGEPWYVVAKTKKEGHTVGIVRDGSVTIFDEIDPQEFIKYIKEEIFPLILRKEQVERTDEENDHNHLL